jgi:Tol biopolymer transport system component
VVRGVRCITLTRLGLAGLVVAAVVSPLCAASSPAAAASAPAGALSGTLIFSSNADGDTDVYAARARDGRVRLLSRNHDADEVSSFGTTVVRRWRDAVYVLGANGRWRRLGGASMYPDGSPKLFARGRRAAFARGETLLIAHVNGRRLWRVPFRGESADISPDGRRVAFTTSKAGRPGVVLVDVGTGKSRPLATASGSKLSTSWSPVGSFLLIRSEREGRDDEYRLADVRSTRRPRLLSRTELGSSEGWSADGRWLAFRSVERRGAVTFVRAQTGRRWTTRAGGYVEASSWSPRGARLAFQYSRGNRTRLVVIDAAAGRTRTLTRSRSLSSSYLWAPDGRRIAFVERPTESTSVLAVVGTSGRGRRALWRGNDVSAMGWHPGGKRLVFAAGQTVGVVGTDGRLWGRSRATFDAPDELVWSPQGDAVAFAAGYGGASVYVLRADGKRLARITRRGRDAVLAWLRTPLPRRGRPAPKLPSTERPLGHALDTRGPVVAVSAHGRAAAVLVAPHELDCIHPVVWRPGQRVVRIGTPAPCRDDDEDEPLDVKLTRNAVHWSDYSCGNNCYVDSYEAPRAPTDAVRYVGEDTYDGRPEPAPPPVETRRGVSILVRGGVVRLQRLADAAERTISAPGARIFDAELEDDGLFYAFNRPRGEFLGRVVFVPFDELFA